MLKVRRSIAVGAAGALGAAALLPACYVGPGRPRTGPEISDCVKPQLSFEPVDGMTAENIVLAGRITLDGKPLAKQVLIFQVRVSKDTPIIWSRSGRTDQNGRIAVNMAWEIARFRTARRAFDEGRFVEVEYINPAEQKKIEPPGWCSTEITRTFAPAR